MSVKKKWYLGIGTACILMILCVVFLPDQNKDTLSVLTVFTADRGGTMYPVGNAIAKALETGNRKINVSASNGSTMNVESLLSGEADLALVAGSAARTAYRDGEEDSSLRAIAAVFYSQSNWLAPDITGIRYVHELSGLRLGVGPEGSTTEHSALDALRAVGAEQQAALVNCGLGAGVDLIREGSLDAIHGFSGAPIGSLKELADQYPCRLLLYTPEELEAILRSDSIYVPVTVPAGTYRGQLENVDTFGVKCLLCVDASMDEELVFELTKALWEAREELVRGHPAMAPMKEDTFLYQALPIPLHNGAKRFYEGQSIDFAP